MLIWNIDSNKGQPTFFNCIEYCKCSSQIANLNTLYPQSFSFNMAYFHRNNHTFFLSLGKEKKKNRHNNNNNNNNNNNKILTIIILIQKSQCETQKPNPPSA